MRLAAPARGLVLTGGHEGVHHAAEQREEDEHEGCELHGEPDGCAAQFAVVGLAHACPSR